MLKNSDFMGTERIFPLLLKLSVPAAVGMLVNSLYNVVDTIFVGQGVGPVAIAALSIAFPIQLLIGSIAQAIGVGAASIISRRLGAKDTETAVSAAGTAITSISVMALFMVLILYVFMKPILVFFGATETILPYAKDYMNFIAAGFFFLSFSMATSALIRAEGNTKVSMNGMIIGTVTNLVLDPIFIFALKMGIKGAAIATIIAQFFSASYLLSYYLRGKSVLPMDFRHLRVRFRLFRESFFLGVPHFLQMAGTSIVALIINNILGRLGGDFAISTYGMIHRLFSLIILPLLGIVQGFQPAAGYNYGASNFSRVRETLLKACLLSTIVSTVGFALMRIFPRTLMSMFTSDMDLIASRAGAIRLFVLAVPVIGIQLIGAAYFQAIGKKSASLGLTLLRQYILLIPLIFIMSSVLGIKGVWLSFPLADGIGTVITVIFLLIEARRLARNIQA